MSARRRWTKCWASRSRWRRLASPARSSGRSANRGRAGRAGCGTPPPCRECGVAVTRIRCRSGSAARPRDQLSSAGGGRRDPSPASAQVCASSTMTSSGQARTKSSRRRSDLMKSVDTMTWSGSTSKSDWPTAGRARAGRRCEASTSSASRWNLSAQLAPATARRGAAGTARRAGGRRPGRAARVAISAGLDRLADADVVGDEQPHRVELAAPSAAARAGRAGARRRSGRASGTGRRWSGTRAAARRAAGGPSGGRRGRSGSGSANVAGATGFELGEDAGDLVVGAAERADHEEVVVGVGQHHPLAAAGADQRSDGEAHRVALPEHVAVGCRRSAAQSSSVAEADHP